MLIPQIGTKPEIRRSWGVQIIIGFEMLRTFISIKDRRTQSKTGARTVWTQNAVTQCQWMILFNMVYYYFCNFFTVYNIIIFDDDDNNPANWNVLLEAIILPINALYAPPPPCAIKWNHHHHHHHRQHPEHCLITLGYQFRFCRCCNQWMMMSRAIVVDALVGVGGRQNPVKRLLFVNNDRVKWWD